MLGTFILDDYYFFFEENDIKELAQTKKIVGAFATSTTQMDLVVSVHKVDLGHISSSITMSSEIKQTVFFITEDDFDEWLLNPTDWVREHGPAWRCASCNVYISRETSSNAGIRKKEIENFITQAK